jgi:hypothetical protein
MTVTHGDIQNGAFTSRTENCRRGGRERPASATVIMPRQIFTGIIDSTRTLRWTTT